MIPSLRPRISLPGEPVREPFHERKSLVPLVIALRKAGTLRFTLADHSDSASILHRAPSGGMVMSQRGRVFGVKNPATAEKWIFSRTTLGSITEKVIQSALSLYGGQSVSPVYLQKVWEEEVNYASQLLAYETKLLEEYDFGGLMVSALDSYSGGNCLMGTRDFVNQMMPLGYHFANYVYLASCLDYRDWKPDRLKAIAWAYAASKQAPL